MKLLHIITYCLVFSLLFISSVGFSTTSKITRVDLDNISINKILKKEHSTYLFYEGSVVVTKDKVKEITNFEYYRSSQSKTSPLVMIFTGVGGISFVERKIARFFVHNKVSVVVTEFKQFDNIKTITSFTNKIKEAIKLTFIQLEYFSKQPKINANKIATIGISLGGFRALYLSSLSPKIKAATLVVTGKSLPNTIAKSNLSLAKRIRRLHMGSIKTSSSAHYIKVLEQHLNLKSLTYRSKDHYFLFMAENDFIVPFYEQKNLWYSLGKPRFQLTGGGHVSGVLHYSFKGLEDTLNFFKKRWNLKNARHTKKTCKTSSRLAQKKCCFSRFKSNSKRA